MTIRGAVLLTIGALLALAGAVPWAVARSGTSAEGVSVRAVVPKGRLGEYRHGTFPSSGRRTHVGVDIVAPCGTPVLALEAGTIVDRIPSRSDPDFRSLGFMVIVEHPASLTGRVFYSLYLHLQGPPVATELVARGEELGRVGATGRATGCHVHFEVRYFPARVSPLWRNIYGPGDQRTSEHLRKYWEDPVAFIARLERERRMGAPPIAERRDEPVARGPRPHPEERRRVDLCNSWRGTLVRSCAEDESG
jgi:murein DD-endopeptidase MepM/ murein hydrolase activator NlpD